MSTFLKSREVEENIPNNGKIFIRQELFLDSLSTVAQDDYVSDYHETYFSSNLNGGSHVKMGKQLLGNNRDRTGDLPT